MAPISTAWHRDSWARRSPSRWWAAHFTKLQSSLDTLDARAHYLLESELWRSRPNSFGTQRLTSSCRRATERIQLGVGRAFCMRAPNMLPCKKISSVYARKRSLDSDSHSDYVTGYSYEKHILLPGCPLAPVATHCMYSSARYYN